LIVAWIELPPGANPLSLRGSSGGKGSDALAASLVRLGVERLFRAARDMLRDIAERSPLLGGNQRSAANMTQTTSAFDHLTRFWLRQTS
jgi:hypothetical protein